MIIIRVMNNIKFRWLSAQLQSALKTMPVVVITGPRQTGKTTLAKFLIKDASRQYFSFDDLDIQEQANANPDSLLQQLPVTIDEVQRVPSFLLAVKKRVDAGRKPGMILLTGSANLALLKTVSESLAGRAYYLELPPFAPLEWTETKDPLAPVESLFGADFSTQIWPTKKGDWKSWVLRGGFPPALALTDATSLDLWFSGYVQTYLERDLRDLQQISNLPDFRRLMRLAANRVGRLFNQSEVARDAGLSQPTAHRYLNLLETTYQIERLPVYSTNPSIPLIKSKKLFWKDSGLGAWLAGISDEKVLKHRPDIGFWLEQSIFQTLQSWRSLSPAHRNIYYWRNQKGNEVDFILEQNGDLAALEIKSGSQVTPADAKNLIAFRDSLPKKNSLVRSLVLFDGTTARPLGDNIFALPFGWLFPV
jgi:predicted AAA+ superfamily ATPase